MEDWSRKDIQKYPHVCRMSVELSVRQGFISEDRESIADLESDLELIFGKDFFTDEEMQVLENYLGSLSEERWKALTELEIEASRAGNPPPVSDPQSPLSEDDMAMDEYFYFLALR